MPIRIVDLQRWFSGDEQIRNAVAADIDASMRDAGFVVITGHGVPEALAGELRAALQRAFALPTDVKTKYQVRELGLVGWVPPGMEANGYAFGEETPPDLKESLVFQTTELPGRGQFVPNVWPTEVPELRQVVTDYLLAMEALHVELLRMLARALGLDDDYLAVKASHAVNTMNTNWYPPLTVTGTPAFNQFRIGPHSDFGTITILDRQPGLGGLQVQIEDDEWTDAPWEPGSLTVNCGDLLQLWTGGRWRSARHRVLPPSADAPEESLISLIYFCEPDADTVVEPLPVEGARKFAPVLAGEYLAEKMRQITVTG